MQLTKVYSEILLVSGKGFGNTELSAFDSALRDAGIGNLNLVRVSSIVPRGCRIVEKLNRPLIEGEILPCVYTHYESNRKGEVISSAISVALGPEYGVIAEYSGPTSKKDSERISEEIAIEMIEGRGLDLERKMKTSVELRVSDNFGSVVSAALFVR